MRTQERVLACFDRRTGKPLWQQTVLRSPLETKHALNSFASSTPATDGELVYVSFLEVDGRTIPAPTSAPPRPITPGRMVVAAYDFAGNRSGSSAPASSSALTATAAAPCCIKTWSSSTAITMATAISSRSTKTRATRLESAAAEQHAELRHADHSRHRRPHANGPCPAANASPASTPTMARRIWTIDGPTEQFVASMVYDGKLLFMAAGFPTFHVLGIRPDGRGNVTDTHVAWHATSAKCYVPSPVVVGGYLLVADDRGTANCFVAETGERLWQERLGSHFSASLVTAGGLVYLIADDGLTKVVRPGPS